MKKQAKLKPKYSLKPSGEFVIENYNFSKPFANFFPGIAGPFGIPIWSFYVNRGQAISSFGTKDKDHAILEFYPANKAWSTTPILGFRSFIKIASGKKSAYYEPFQNIPANQNFEISNLMSITSYDLKLQEENKTLSLLTNVEYFTIPNDNFGALCRIITIKNTSKVAKKIQLLDGLPQINPFGTNNWLLKEMSRTIEAWMKVENLDKNVAYYKLAVDPADRPEVVHIKEGNFYLAFEENNKSSKIIKPIVDPTSIFGPVTDYTSAFEFANSNNFTYPKNQSTQNKTPCAFFYKSFDLNPGQTKTFCSITGYMINQEMLNTAIPNIIKPGYIQNKRLENKKIIDDLQNDISTTSSSKAFDLYTKQTYLDNILRGGYPITFKNNSHSTVFYLYSRKHGDLERDYNKFSLQPTYFSQGNGNYRDVNQNRRSDVWFNPQVQENNVIDFFNLLQTDGFNPLVVKGLSFSVNDFEFFKNKLASLVKKNTTETKKLEKLLSKPFAPGDVALFIEEHRIELEVSREEFISILLSNSHKNQEAEHGEGYWTDHWTYNLDLLENYLAIFPENKNNLLFNKKIFTYFDDIEIVKPRKDKFVISNGQVKQFQSVIADLVKKELLHKRTKLAHTVRTQYGTGEIYQTTLINKILCLIANKFSSLDPQGIGIEMEANKPNWYDALNGLPGLLGSSLNEALELKRIIIFTVNALKESTLGNLSITEEVFNFIISLNEPTKNYFLDTSLDRDLQYWEITHSIKEDYRLKTKLGVNGTETVLSVFELTTILENFLKKIDLGIEKAYDKQKNVYYTYFINEIAQYQNIDNYHLKPLRFISKRLPLYLESQVHALKISDPQKAKKLYNGVKKSGLFDKKLKMYKVCESLQNMPEEIGRCRVFAPGWLENESIWLHMEYKYLLEVLRSGLHAEFYNEFKNLLIPFLKPEIYGRSILENSSFIVSSAFQDSRLHGNGFVARLSGSTAEYLQIWLIMNCGMKPFFLNEKNELTFKLEPILAGWLFNKNGTYIFNFLSKIKVTYHNPKLKDTFGKTAAKINRIVLKDKFGKITEFNSDFIPSFYAKQIRNLEITAIDAYFV